MTYRYPVLLDLSNCSVVIIGGGAVAARKAASLIEAGAAHIRVISPDFHADLPPSVERILAHYTPDHLQGARLAFAATNSSEVNSAVVRDARHLGIWVNRADSGEDYPGDFTIPAQLRAGASLLLTVSADGSPSLAANLRDSLRDSLDPRWPRLAEALHTIRPRIRNTVDIEHRRTILRDLASTEALEIISHGDAQSLWQWAVARHPELAQP